MDTKISIDTWVESFINFLTDNFEGLFEVISVVLGSVVSTISDGLLLIHPLVFIGLMTILAWKVSRWSVAVFTLFGLLLIVNLGYWEHAAYTIALVMTSVIISIVFGLPLGIASATSKKFNNILTPILDFMQTMPAYIYLIPAIFFFGLGTVPGVFASVIFAMPPTIRMTSLGIRQISEELIEAADAFGSTSMQKLIQVQLPLAMPAIMAGINQSIMLSLSMVVIASMIGAPGLGTEVYRAITQLKIGMGFEAGLSIVILAIVLDRLSQNIGQGQRRM
ncbi:ABC transporter permease [Ammoniphilus sp. 3BR4]|uniref:ABC transporter permease n=1 Tax=Ammoniphilus sp. 3BR4 TaxID=3158265 RepID=UPI003465FBA1